MRFGEYIQNLRIVKGYNLTTAAKELGITPQRLCDIEAGRRHFTKNPPLELLKKIAVVYDHPFTNLVTNTEFFTYEKSIIADLLATIEPVSENIERNALEMLVEAKQYTPEMEALAIDAFALSGDLKTALALAKARFTKSPRSHTLENGLPLKRVKEGS